MSRNRLLFGIGIGIIVLGILLILRIPYFFYHSNSIGHQLLQQADQVVQKHSTLDSHSDANVLKLPKNHDVSSESSANNPPKSNSIRSSLQVIGKLEIPTLSLEAPIVEGTNESQIDVAIGHLSTSVQPGSIGTSILAAHNATWFRHIDQLKDGDRGEVITTKGTYTFVVQDKKIKKVGYDVDNTQYPSLILESCYPLDALYLTPYRYLVYAKLLTTPTGST